MEERSIGSIKATITGVEELKKYAAEVIEKADELEEAIQRLNNVKIEVKI